MKPWMRYALVGVAGLVLGIVIAKYTLPPKVTEVDRVVVKEVEVVRWKDRIVKEEGPVRIVTKTRTVPGPAGPTVEVEKIVEREKVVTVTVERGSKDSATTVEKEHSKITDSRPWFALEAMGAMAPGTGQWAWTGGAQIRALGPLWVGAGAVKADQWYFGPSLRMEF